jgi:hypothetical protein
MFIKRSPLLAAILLAIFTLGGSAAGQETTPTPNTNIEPPKVYVDLIDPMTVRDAFGRRISNRFVVLQVTISNPSERFQYLLHDVSLDLSKIVVDPNTARGYLAVLATSLRELESARTEAAKGPTSLDTANAVRKVDRQIEELREKHELRLSSLELGVVRGVAEKGQLSDPRNFVFRLLRGIGTLAAGFMGVTSLGASYAPSVAFFNGPGLTAYNEALPDFTVNQMNRLNDLAYRSNTVIPRQQAKVMVAFLPQSLMMDNEEREMFKNRTVELLAKLDFRQVAVSVNGSYIQELDNTPVQITAMQIAPDEALKFQDATPEVHGVLLGHGLKDVTIGFTSSVPGDATITPDADSTDEQLSFTIAAKSPIPPGTPLNIRVAGAGGNSQITQTASYISATPTMTAIEGEATVGEGDIAVKVTGTNFLPNLTNRNFFFNATGAIPIVKEAIFRSPTQFDLVITVGENIKPQDYQLHLTGSPSSQTFKVKAKPEAVKEETPQNHSRPNARHRGSN